MFKSKILLLSIILFLGSSLTKTAEYVSPIRTHWKKIAVPAIVIVGAIVWMSYSQKKDKNNDTEKFKETLNSRYDISKNALDSQNRLSSTQRDAENLANKKLQETGHKIKQLKEKRPY